MAFPTITLQYLIPIPPLMVIAFVLCVLRIWTRFRARKLYLDDYLIIVAEVGGVSVASVFPDCLKSKSRGTLTQCPTSAR
jgi:hypothetical protein